MSVITPGIELYVGNVRWVNFRLRQFGKRAPLSVSSAQRIAVEFAKIGEAPLPKIYASRTAPNADWIAGIVPVLVTPGDLTARDGSYNVAVTVYDHPEEVTASIGRVEVLPRPIAGALTIPAGGSYTAGAIQSAPNAGAAVIPAGAPVARTSAGVVLAYSGPGFKSCDGVAIANTAPGATCLYINNGSVRLPDWTAVFGAPALPTGATIYLGVAPGVLTDAVPTAPTAAIQQVVGETAADAQTLNLANDYGVVL